MELHFSLEQMARLHESVRVVAAQAGELAGDLRAQLAHAEADLRHALPDQGATLRGRVAVARQLGLDARAHQVAIDRLVIDLGAEPAGQRRLPPVVLIADDQRDTREWLTAMLHGAGFMVRTATNGVEALIAAYQTQPAVVLMDLDMPVLDGVEATRLIKAVDQLRPARVIAHTAEHLAAASAHGELFTAFLPKPSPADLILTVVQRWAHSVA